MASAKSTHFSNTIVEQLFCLSLGHTGDSSGAMYDGDFTISLEEAQQKKHQFIADQLHIGKNTRVLDVGCGWGGFLSYIKSLGARGQGITLSSGQTHACNQNGLQVSLMDARHLTAHYQGKFDAITCIGSFEHICSLSQWKEGRQNDVYIDFFHTIASLLPVGGRLYIQTSVLGPTKIPFEKISLLAPKNSDAYALALLTAQFAGSWIPQNARQIINSAIPEFKLVSLSNGRLDYINTIGEWRKRFRKFGIKKYMLFLSLLLRMCTRKSFKYRLETFRKSPDRICFQRQLTDHYRFVFEKL